MARFCLLMFFCLQAIGSTLETKYEVLIGIRKYFNDDLSSEEMNAMKDGTLPYHLSKLKSTNFTTRSAEGDPSPKAIGHPWVEIRKGSKEKTLKREFHLTDRLFLYDPTTQVLEYYGSKRRYRERRMRRPCDQRSGVIHVEHFRPPIFTRNLNMDQLIAFAQMVRMHRVPPEDHSESADFCALDHHFIVQFVLAIVDEKNYYWLRKSRHHWPKNVNWLEDRQIQATNISVFLDSWVKIDEEQTTNK